MSYSYTRKLNTTAFVLVALTTFSFDIAYGMEDNIDYEINQCNQKTQKNIIFEKQEEINQMISEYHNKGKPINLAVACGSTEMPNKIKNEFKSLSPAKEQWLALDLLLTDKDDYHSGPHIRMDAIDTDHWSQLCKYLKEQKIEVETIAFTAFGPDIHSDLLKETIMPIVKKGGRLVWPSYFSTNYSDNKSADIMTFGNIFFMRYMLQTNYNKFNSTEESPFLKDVKNYHSSEGDFHNNKEALFEATLKWTASPSMGESEAAKELAAKVYVNRVISFKSELLDDLLNYKIRRNDQDASFLFSKKPEEFTKDFIGFFREYMTKIGYEESSYEIYSDNCAELYGVTEYKYPQDGTYSLVGYSGSSPSLVLFKK